MVQQTPAGRRQHVEFARLTQTRQNLRDERATPQGDPARRNSADIDQDLQQVQQDLDAQQVLQDATTAGVRRAGELLGYLIMHATKPNVGKCLDNLDVSTLQEFVCNSTPC